MSGWRSRSLQSKQRRLERAVAKGYYKPKELEVDEHLAKGLIAQWNIYREGGTDKRWADFDDLCDDTVEPPLFLDDFCEVSDEAVEVPTLVCPPPPPPLDWVETPVASRATTQLIECQNSTIAVLSASLQALSMQSTGGGSQMEKQDILGWCQIYIQDHIGKLEKKFKEELLEIKTEYRTFLLTFQEVFLKHSERLEQLEEKHVTEDGKEECYEEAMEKRKVADSANPCPKVAAFSSNTDLNIKKSVHFVDSPEILEYYPTDWSDIPDFFADPYFDLLRQSLDAPDVGPLVCNIYWRKPT